MKKPIFRRLKYLHVAWSSIIFVVIQHKTSIKDANNCNFLIVVKFYNAKIIILTSKNPKNTNFFYRKL